jgi:sugar phosphate isomerase/epimerase
MGADEMYKNLNPASLGVSGRQSELIELALTYGFKGLDLEGGDLVKRATLLGVEEAAKYIRSGGIKIGGWSLPVQLTANDRAFQTDIERLSSLAPTAKEVGFQTCAVDIEPGCDDLPFHENFERHRERLGKVGDILEPCGIRLGLRLRPTSAQRKGRKFPFIHQAEELLTLIRTTNHAAVGLALDTWSWQVGGGANDQLSELQGHQIVTVSIADVPDEVDMAAVAVTDRLLPSEGAIPGHGRLLAMLAERGYQGPVTLVPHSSKLAKLTRDASVDKCASLMSKLWVAAGLSKPPKSSVVEEQPQDETPAAENA